MVVHQRGVARIHRPAVLAQQPVGQNIDPLVAQVEQAIQAADASIAQLQLSSKDLGEDPSVDGVHDALERLRRAVY